MDAPFGQGITWLYSDDLDRHAAFYRDVIGLPQVLDQGGCRVFRSSPTGFLGVCDIPHRPRGTAGMLVTFLVPDLDAAMARLSARGAAFDGPVREKPGHRSAFLRDPVGYLLEVQQFTDPRWPA